MTYRCRRPGWAATRWVSRGCRSRSCSPPGELFTAPVWFTVADASLAQFDRRSGRFRVVRTHHRVRAFCLRRRRRSREPVLRFGTRASTPTRDPDGVTVRSVSKVDELFFDCERVPNPDDDQFRPRVRVHWTAPRGQPETIVFEPGGRAPLPLLGRGARANYAAFTVLLLAAGGRGDSGFRLRPEDLLGLRGFEKIGSSADKSTPEQILRRRSRRRARSARSRGFGREASRVVRGLRSAYVGWWGGLADSGTRDEGVRRGNPW